MSNWIAVKERLPAYGQLCIVSGNAVQYCLYSLDDESGKWIPLDEDFEPAPFEEFTHWQPLPVPPDEAK